MKYSMCRATCQMSPLFAPRAHRCVARRTSVRGNVISGVRIIAFVLALHAAIAVSRSLAAESPLRGAGFELVVDESRGGITSLKHSPADFDTEYIKRGTLLGNVAICYRRPQEAWSTVRLDDSNRRFTLLSKTERQLQVRYRLPQDLEVTKTWTLAEANLTWQINLRNRGRRAVEIGDIALPLQMNTDYVGGDLQDKDAVSRTYQHRLNRHRLVAGHGSFACWMRANGVGPYLVMTPVGSSYLEYFDDEHTAFIHSARSGPAETRGTWRQPHTGLSLAPAGEKNDCANYEFIFSWAEDYDGVRDVLYENGGFDVHVVPGMTAPSNLSARIAVRTRNRIVSVQPEHPLATKVVYLGETQPDVHIYELTFARLGENFVQVNCESGRRLFLEFFTTEPLETLYRKRARFITEKQQHRNDRWYNGLFSLWDMREKVLRGPENTGGLQDYMVGGSDDPSNSKAVLVAEKNVILPDAKEIAALEYYLEHFVWGKLQRTDQEYPHPYGIYGSENWHLNRTTRWGTALPERIRSYEKTYGVPQGTGLAAERMWRSFDYTTFIMLYFDMHRIAKDYPHLVHYLDARGYLERAFGTARAYFQVPYSIHMVGKPLWSHKGYSDWAYKLGNFHERYVVDVISALRDEGLMDQADWLQGEWEKKVKYFLYDEPFPFGSEFVFDRTAFESTHAVAKYAIENPLQPDQNLWYDKNLNRWYSHPDVRPEHAAHFMKRQIDANISMRGWLETAYYYLGSARVGANTLDYMSQMGGWSILDYGLHFNDEPAKYIRLGYASLLSSWALVNSGSAETDYGYWYPGVENDGAAGWNFQTQKYGKAWALGTSPRGIWPYGGEIDHGLAGGIRAAAAVVMDDPIFGRIALGGTLQSQDGMNEVVPADGARRRLHILTDDHRLHLLLNSDGFKKGEPVAFDDELRRIAFQLENRAGSDHQGSFDLHGLPVGDYEVLLNGRKIHSFTTVSGRSVPCTLRVTAESDHAVLIRRRKARQAQNQETR